MTQSSDDAPTGPICGTQVQPAPADAGRANVPSGEQCTKQANLRRDLVGAGLVIAAASMPWNLYFGIGIPESKQHVFALLLVVTALTLTAVTVTHVGPWRLSSARFNPARVGQLRLALNIPYLLLVLGFVVFDAFETIRSGGTVHVPGGVGPGGWVGIAGCLLTAQPVITEAATDDAHFDRWLRATQIVGYASMFGAALSTGFNLCWRIRYALQPAAGTSGMGTQNLAVIATAVVYGIVALLAVLIASRWLLQGTPDSRLSTTALGASTLIAGIVVWVLPIGREIDAFHGIAQNTSTAGVGYEGYLAWAAAAAILAPRTLFSSRGTTPIDGSAWRSAVQNGLLLVAVWCLGSVVMRLTDLVVAVMLNYPSSRYDIITLTVFDLATAILAVWVRINLAHTARPTRLIAALSGLLLTLTFSRVIVGIVLAPRFENSGASPNPVYGNNLAQQITSTFDVMLCGLSLCILAAVIAGHLGSRRRPPRPATQRRPPAPPPVPSEATTTRFEAPGVTKAPATTMAAPGASPRIFRDPAQQSRPKLYRPPNNST